MARLGHTETLSGGPIGESQRVLPPDELRPNNPKGTARERSRTKKPLSGQAFTQEIFSRKAIFRIGVLLMKSNFPMVAPFAQVERVSAVIGG